MSATRPTTQKEFHQAIRARGYLIDHGGKHLAVRRPDGTRIMTLPVTPSDRRALLNAWCTFKRITAADH